MPDTKPADKFTEADVLLFASLASREEDKDPIDNAILTHTKQSAAKELTRYKETAFKPFDPVIKRTEATIQDPNGQVFKVTKGAPQVILQLTAAPQRLADVVNHEIDAFASKGHRALGVAKTDSVRHWQYVGLIALYDPPREDSAETIKTAQFMGVKVKMVTGDHIAIAKEISSEVNLGSNIALPDSFLNQKEKDAQKTVERADGFAEVFPEHKYQIVELLQNKGHIVGMTGDGVNDAPALKEADAGIAVTGATDAANPPQTSCSLNPAYQKIDDIKEKPQNFPTALNNYAIYRIAETIRVLFFIVASILVFNFYPVTAS